MTADVITRRPPKRLPSILVVALGAICMVAGLGAVVLHDHAAPDKTSYVATTTAASGLAADITRTQQRLRQLPRDDAAWATLGIDYVQQAKATADPTYFPKAAGALRHSLRLPPRDHLPPGAR